jgi:hypothetical protein
MNKVLCLFFKLLSEKCFSLLHPLVLFQQHRLQYSKLKDRALRPGFVWILFLVTAISKTSSNLQAGDLFVCRND